MKKRSICFCLALLLAVTPASAAFTDISNRELAQTASVLDALGIMQGVGGGRFDPNGALTRAQFCKLAVTALGITDVSAYGSYTIFPDVRNTHWAAKYINAAVRHPSLKDQAIIRGYADGTFKPDKTVDFGEVCTMLLRMLGYTEADVGPFWPTDYVARAQDLGLTDGVSITDPKVIVRRSDAAMMLLRTLDTERKGEESGLLIDKVAASTVKDCILLATSETDSTLAANEAVFYEGGAVSASPRRTAGTLDSSLIGIYGTLVIGKGQTGAVVGLIPNGNKRETFTVVSAAADRIETTQQTLRPARETKLYVASEGRQLGTFGESWSSLQQDDVLTLYYDEYGALELIAALPKTGRFAGTSFVYGLSGSAAIPEGYTIVKNGVTIDRTKLKKYDVITLNGADRQALVSDARLTGQYEEGAPTFRYPQSVKVCGQTYHISTRAAQTFQDSQLKEPITLLFDVNGAVVAAYPTTEVRADMQGIVTKLDGAKATVALLNGMTLRDISIRADGQTGLMGQLVSVGQSADGTIYLTRRNPSGKASGAWDIAAHKLGDRSVSPKVRVYEQVAEGAPLSAIALSAIEVSRVPTDQIRYTMQDSAGSITSIVLDDVTGQSWQYGIAASKNKGAEDDGNSVVQLQYWDGTQCRSTSYTVVSLPSGLGGVPVGIPKGYAAGDGTIHRSLTTRRLKLVDTVQRSAFDGSLGVRTKDGHYALDEDIGVYVNARDTFISLQNARSNYSTFRLYADRTAAEGGKIRVIVAS